MILNIPKTLEEPADNEEVDDQAETGEGEDQDGTGSKDVQNQVAYTSKTSESDKLIRAFL